MTTAPHTRGAPVAAPYRTAQPARSTSSPGQLALLARPMASYYIIVGVTMLLVGLGLVMVFSASAVEEFAANQSSTGLLRKQLMWVALGLPAMWAASRLPVRFFRLLAYPLLLAAIALNVLVLVIGIGENGAVRWLQIGPITMQPSELAKIALVLWGADLYARKTKLLTDWKHVVMPLLPVATVLVALVMLQRDMGTTLTILCIVVALLWVVGLPTRQFVAFFAAIAALCVLLAVSEPYRLARVRTYLNPDADPLGAGLQAIQGRIGIAQGGWFGLGLGNSRQKWGILPNSETDFIFAIIGEELGLLGTLIVVALFGLLAYVGIRTAQRSTDPFSRYASAAVTVWLLGQAVINMGAVVGLVPITGIPLPLISSGGSALVTTLVALGMLASFARREPGAAEALAARGIGPVARTARWAARYYGFGPAPAGSPGTSGRRRRRRRRGSQ
ncbi:MAG: putative lipid II flippase FtsW [Mycobacteriales bacterium]